MKVGAKHNRPVRIRPWPTPDTDPGAMTRRVIFRCTEAQWQKMKAHAQRAGVSVSEWIRRRAAG